MLKLLGAVLLIAGGFLAGTGRALALRRRTAALADLRQLIQDLRTGVEFGARPLPELIRSCGGSRFCRLAGAVPDFSAHPKEALLQAGRRLLEDPADMELYRVFLSRLGESGTQSQLEHLELYAALTEQQLSAAREAAERKSRLFVTLGLFGGVTLCLIFV